MAVREHITAPPIGGAEAVALLRSILDHTDVIIEGEGDDRPDRTVALLVLAPADLRERLERFGADSEDDEDGHPDEDGDPPGGNVEDEGEADNCDDEPSPRPRGDRRSGPAYTRRARTKRGKQ